MRSAIRPATRCGSIPVHGACQGLQLGLDGVGLVTTLTAGAGGAVDLTLSAPAAACGLPVHAVDLAACAASNEA